MEATLKTHLPTNSVAPSDITSRLAHLTTMSDVVLFMEGSPSTTQCHHNGQVVAILKDHHVQYSSFDILSDNDVRESLKGFGNFSIYPQLWVSGKLLGGLDVLEELLLSGDLESVLCRPVNVSNNLEKLVKRAPVMIFIKGCVPMITDDWCTINQGLPTNPSVGFRDSWWHCWMKRMSRLTTLTFFGMSKCAKILKSFRIGPPTRNYTSMENLWVDWILFENWINQVNWRGWSNPSE